MSNKWVCIHGHFYQPPRENPWLEAIEPQSSAHPYRDWNERITAECYRPNAAARVVDNSNHIIKIVDNYQRMSFNVGPTLMSWLEEHARDVHDALIEADRASAQRFGGHGSAMAQAFNHMIMPLASARDRVTQVRWGIADFTRRFGRRPEGMWLPECAANTDSLETLAAEGIAFTVLAPGQAKAWRPPDGTWRTTPVDPGRAYKCLLPSGRTIDLFFYDGATAQAVAFERLLADGHKIISRMTDRGPAEGGEPTLCHIATDGETYGHHHRYGDMALAWALAQVEQGWNGTRLTNYAEYRAKVPATWEVQLAEDSSWSCAHGISRWRDDCGCNSGGKPGWNQRWRRPLRDALDWLSEQAGAALDNVGRLLFHDPWAARDAYVEVLLERSATARDRFLATHGSHALDPEERVRALSLMEMARHAMLMYTSCGWFFDDLSGIETVQCMQYAARVAELIEDVGGDPVEPAFVDRLSAARSNLADEGDGRRVWERRVLPAKIDPAKVGAHVAVLTLVEPGAAKSFDVYGYHVDFIDRMERRSGRARIVAGTVRVRSRLTEGTTALCFAGLHLGEQHVTGGVRLPPADSDWSQIVDELSSALQIADVFAAQRAVDRHFPGAQLSLSALLPGSRERVLSAVLGDVIATAEAELSLAFDTQAPLIRWLVAHQLPVPDVLRTTVQAALHRRVLVNLRAADPSFQQLRDHMAEAALVQVNLDTPEIALAASEGLRRLIDRLIVTDGELDPHALETVARAADVASRMKSAVDLWFVQNATFRLIERLPALRRRGHAGEAKAARLAADLERLAGALGLAVPP
ncbi:MAG: glycoside hydrolase family 57 [Deltaproteobacteria bacterium]|nr:glycoside hydrolase family 57 [Deltaproteobacteria bacterium]